MDVKKITQLILLVLYISADLFRIGGGNHKEIIFLTLCLWGYFLYRLYPPTESK